MFNGAAVQNGQLTKTIEAYRPDIVVFENAERCNYRFDEMISNADKLRECDYKLGSEIPFYGNDESSEKYQILGFVGKDDGYTWTDGNTASMLMYLTDAKAGGRMQGHV